MPAVPLPRRVPASPLTAIASSVGEASVPAAGAIGDAASRRSRWAPVRVPVVPDDVFQ